MGNLDRFHMQHIDQLSCMLHPEVEFTQKFSYSKVVLGTVYTILAFNCAFKRWPLFGGTFLSNKLGLPSLDGKNC